MEMIPSSDKKQLGQKNNIKTVMMPRFSKLNCLRERKTETVVMASYGS